MAQRKQSRPTIPVKMDPAVAAFEERVRTVGEWKARVENICSVVPDFVKNAEPYPYLEDDIITKVMSEVEIEALRARCLHD